MPDPADVTGQTHYMYIIGGRDDTGTYLSSIDWTKVNAPASNEQYLVNPVAAPDPQLFEASTAALSDARWLLGAVYSDEAKTPTITNTDAWVYALPGEDDPSGSGGVNQITALKVNVLDGTDDGDGIDGDGSLSTVTEVPAPNNKFTGYAYVCDNDFIHLMGGRNNSPASTGMESPFEVPAPSLEGWDAGTNMGEARQFMGTAYESSFIFLLGGESADPATNTVESSIF